MLSVSVWGGVAIEMNVCTHNLFLSFFCGMLICCKTFPISCLSRHLMRVYVVSPGIICARRYAYIASYVHVDMHIYTYVLIMYVRYMVGNGLSKILLLSNFHFSFSFCIIVHVWQLPGKTGVTLSWG